MRADCKYALRKLFAEFKLDEMTAMAKLDRARFTKDECLKGTQLQTWAAEVIGYCRALGMDSTMQYMTAIYNRLDVNFKLAVIAPGTGVSLYDWIAYLEERRRVWRASLLTSSSTDNADAPQSFSDKMLKGLPTAPDKLQLTNLSSMEEALETSAGIH
ncbi:uncharacterized protein GGS25DRAFT_378059 [Hypoxylon fragiforme]|uniref:uncharacterized protein n=1 Tax=Hypoxylon fragiforme TaxID=63214 RepID=UPI0020C6D6C3|nr:uncharacterized protein GGS25DRAFT_378059 [Hypoxylon fragiforme]KAI2606196.1 hypothetical protein GGS25DRAFT_378059 [Hypoxylon fragiforme]